MRAVGLLDRDREGVVERQVVLHATGDVALCFVGQCLGSRAPGLEVVQHCLHAVTTDGAHGLPDERIQTSIDLVAVGPGSDGVLLSRTRGHTGLPMIGAERVGYTEMVTCAMLQHLGGSSIPRP